MQEVVGKYQGSKVPFLSLPNSGSLTPLTGRMPKAFGIRQASSGKVRAQTSWVLEFAKSSVTHEHCVVVLEIILVSLICVLNQ